MEEVRSVSDLSVEEFLFQNIELLLLIQKKLLINVFTLHSLNPRAKRQWRTVLNNILNLLNHDSVDSIGFTTFYIYSCSYFPEYLAL